MGPALLCALGLPAGFLLIWRIPRCHSTRSHPAITLSIIIPARNEEHNLPRLLHSIAALRPRPTETLVVDDGSTDNTKTVAQSLGAHVVTSAPLPSGWTGKCWACHQGAQHAIGDLLLFLDADTFFVPGGLERMIGQWLREQDPRFVLSVLPYHAMTAGYEHISLIFNLLMAAGAGGFGVSAQPHLCGQSLLIGREAYFAAGGHYAVRGAVLENLRFASVLRSSGARTRCCGGRGTLHMRMFPDGFRQMSDSWGKAFVQGAAASSGIVLAASVLWISALWTAALLLVVPPDYGRPAIAVVFLLLGSQVAWAARQLGNYPVVICLLYPVPLAYYCLVFGRALIRRALGRKATWRGREV